jgi:integrase/recombinase XerD
MELVFSTSEFVIQKASYEGFPILLDAKMCSVTEANHFLRYYLIQRGRVQSRKTWATYGYHLLDYFSFLEQSQMDWRASQASGEPTILAAYRDQLCQKGISPRTINQRLSTISQYYLFAKREGWLDTIPFNREDVRRSRAPGFLGHLDASGGVKKSTDVVLRTFKRSPSILAPHQIQALLQALSNPMHKLMARLALQVGLRRQEIVTFPCAYVRPPDKGSGMTRVRLDPEDGSGMRTKGRRSRDVWMPEELMRRLWDYKVHLRSNSLQKKSTSSQLFVRSNGQSWCDDGRGFTAIIRRAGERAGLKVWPHVLRHTYASYTLAALQARSTGIDPLVFLQRQLGHSSINTTMEYLHLVDALVERSVTAYDADVSAWSEA